MPNVGIKRFSYKPYNKDYDEFISVLSEVLKFKSKSKYYRISEYSYLATSDGGDGYTPVYNYEFVKYRRNKYDDFEIVGFLEWRLHTFTTIDKLLKEFNISRNTPVDIYIKPKQIILRRYETELIDPETLIQPFRKTPYYNKSQDCVIVPIKEKDFIKFSKLKQPFQFKLNFIKR